MNNPVRGEGISDEEWGRLMEAHQKIQEKASRTRVIEPVQPKEMLSDALSRLEELPPMHIAGTKSVSVETLSSKLLKKSNIPERHYRAWIDHGGKFESQQEWLEKWHKIQSKLGSGGIFGIIGDRGRGKTQMAVNAIIASCQAEESAMFCTAMDFFMKIKGTFHKNSKLDEQEIIDEMLKPRLLVVDEIHERSDTDWENRLIFHAVNKRYEKMYDTILIGAYHDKNPKVATEAFKKAVGASIASRLRETGGIINATWPSFRGD